jgi:AGZA family xanthine/uracil permease-like MFS transporter
MKTYPWFTRGDLDGFFGLFVDNLLQLMLIVTLCTYVVNLPTELTHGTILPAAAISILMGNLFYAWQARRIAMERQRPYTTALPYGINTVSLFAFVFFVMVPVYKETGSPRLAWQAGLFACMGSGLIEIVGAFFGGWLRRHTPRAALLTALAGIALTFIAMGFVFQIFANPVVALIPAFLILISYASRVKLPLKLPGGLVALLAGTAIAWASQAIGYPLFTPDPAPFVFEAHLPVPVFGEAMAYFFNGYGWKFFAAVVLPMGLFNVIGSLQNLESAEAAGDRYPTKSSLLVNGGGTILAALLGSPFPTTIYIGHPGWKSMGARWGYSIANGVVIAALCILGGVTLVFKFVPMEAMLGILLWIGIVITAQAFKDVPRHHHLGVALGFIPSLAAWALILIETSLRVAGTNLFSVADKFGNQLYIHGLIALSQGFLLTATIFAAMLIYITERRFVRAAAWAAAACLLSFFGFIHAYELTEAGVNNVFKLNAAPGFTGAYLVIALLLLALHQFGSFEEDRFKTPRGGRGGRREGWGKRGPDKKTSGNTEQRSSESSTSSASSAKPKPKRNSRNRGGRPRNQLRPDRDNR